MRISRGESIDRFYILQWRGWGIFLHRVHHSDPADLFHDHPWDALSLIFGFYYEERLGQRSKLCFGPHRLPARMHHRVVVGRPVWTLLVHAPRSNSWSVVTREGITQSVEPWRGEAGHKYYSGGKETVDG